MASYEGAIDVTEGHINVSFKDPVTNRINNPPELGRIVRDVLLHLHGKLSSLLEKAKTLPVAMQLASMVGPTTKEQVEIPAHYKEFLLAGLNKGEEEEEEGEPSAKRVKREVLVPEPPAMVYEWAKLPSLVPTTQPGSNFVSFFRNSEDAAKAMNVMNYRLTHGEVRVTITEAGEWDVEFPIGFDLSFPYNMSALARAIAIIEHAMPYVQVMAHLKAKPNVAFADWFHEVKNGAVNVEEFDTVGFVEEMNNMNAMFPLNVLKQMKESYQEETLADLVNIANKAVAKVA